MFSTLWRYNLIHFIISFLQWYCKSLTKHVVLPVRAEIVKRFIIMDDGLTWQYATPLKYIQIGFFSSTLYISLQSPRLFQDLQL